MNCPDIGSYEHTLISVYYAIVYGFWFVSLWDPIQKSFNLLEKFPVVDLGGL